LQGKTPGNVENVPILLLLVRGPCVHASLTRRCENLPTYANGDSRADRITELNTNPDATLRRAHVESRWCKAY